MKFLCALIALLFLVLAIGCIASDHPIHAIAWAMLAQQFHPGAEGE